MSDKNCPFCGIVPLAILDPDKGHYVWQCGTWKRSQAPRQSDNCRIKELEAIVNRLVAWSKKWGPRNRVHSYVNQKECYNELYEIEDLARAATKAAREKEEQPC